MVTGVISGSAAARNSPTPQQPPKAAIKAMLRIADCGLTSASSVEPRLADLQQLPKAEGKVRPQENQR
jgi:hypothetical protein